MASVGIRAAWRRRRSRARRCALRWRWPGACAFVRFGGDHAIEIDQQNQAAVGRDGGAGEKFDAAEIFAEVLDDDFVFAEDFFDDQANLTIVRRWPRPCGSNH